MHTNAKSIEEAVAAHAAAGEFRAGGTDVQERIRSGNLSLPLIDIQAIGGLNDIELHESGATIGALTTLDAISNHARLKEDYPAFTRPTQTLATPQIRNFATLGGSPRSADHSASARAAGTIATQKLAVPKKETRKFVRRAKATTNEASVLTWGPALSRSNRHRRSVR